MTTLKIDVEKLKTFKIIEDGLYKSKITGAIILEGEVKVLQVHFLLVDKNIGITKKWALSGENNKLSIIKKMMVAVLKRDPGKVKLDFITSILINKDVIIDLSYYKDQIVIDFQED